jgi:hypothetical protein
MCKAVKGPGSAECLSRHREISIERGVKIISDGIRIPVSTPSDVQRTPRGDTLKATPSRGSRLFDPLQGNRYRDPIQGIPQRTTSRGPL